VGEAVNGVGVVSQHSAPDDALGYFEEALDIVQHVYPAGHPRIARGLNNVAMSRFGRHDVAGAEPLQREALKIYRATYPPVHREIAKGTMNLAQILSAQRKYEEAEQLLRETIDINRKILSADHPDLGEALRFLGRLVLAQDKPAEAEPLLREAERIFINSRGAKHPVVIQMSLDLASALYHQQKFDEAEQVIRKLVATVESAPGNSTTLKVLKLAAAILGDLTPLTSQELTPARASARCRAPAPGSRDYAGALVRGCGEGYPPLGRCFRGGGPDAGCCLRQVRLDGCTAGGGRADAVAGCESGPRARGGDIDQSVGLGDLARRSVVLADRRTAKAGAQDARLGHRRAGGGRGLGGVPLPRGR
jgi:tetratricopeptide (TPR) repeat protein